MYASRLNETGNLPHRSSRIFCMDNVWYFFTREGSDIGPFDYQAEAYDALQDFLQFIQLANKTIRRSFLSTLINHQKQRFFTLINRTIVGI